MKVHQEGTATLRVILGSVMSSSSTSNTYTCLKKRVGGSCMNVTVLYFYSLSTEFFVGWPVLQTRWNFEKKHEEMDGYTRVFGTPNYNNRTLDQRLCIGCIVVYLNVGTLAKSIFEKTRKRTLWFTRSR